jgi:FKBP-type peptidyl-prolyl cis-trans isomerase
VLGALLAALVVLTSAACRKTPSAPTLTPPFSQTDLVVGTGVVALDGLRLTVRYTGWLYNEARPDQKGAVFDSTVGGETFIFVLGQGTVIEGWERGISGMREGGIRRLVVPPDLAYREFRSGPVPPYSTLLFEIELIAAESTVPVEEVGG